MARVGWRPGPLQRRGTPEADHSGLTRRATPKSRRRTRCPCKCVLRRVRQAWNRHPSIMVSGLEPLARIAESGGNAGEHKLAMGRLRYLNPQRR
eukprot:910830-Rhodomonas_salina.2